MGPQVSVLSVRAADLGLWADIFVSCICQVPALYWSPEGTENQPSSSTLTP